MLFTITGMVESRVSANLMSLGAIDFGIIVDGAVIIVENCLRLLGRGAAPPRPAADAQRALRHDPRRRAQEVIRPSLFGTLIIAVVYLPILTLTGVEGKMFTPMALTVLMALAGAAILSMTFVPAAVALFVTGTRRGEGELLHARRARGSTCRCSSSRCASRRWSRGLRGRCWSSLSGVARLAHGRRVHPSLDEGDIALHALRIPGHQPHPVGARCRRRWKRRCCEFPEVKEVFAKIGTAEVATDPMPPNVADTSSC